MPIPRAFPAEELGRWEDRGVSRAIPNTAPEILDFTNAQHDHQDADDGGQLDHGLAHVAASLLDDDHTQYTTFGRALRLGAMGV